MGSGRSWGWKGCRAYIQWGLVLESIHYPESYKEPVIELSKDAMKPYLFLLKTFCNEIQ